MNIDDFIFPQSVGSPAGISPSPSADRLPSDHATAPAISIKHNAKSKDDSFLTRASAPSVPPHADDGTEFGYVQKHVRKTSIDERRVSRTPLVIN